MDNQKQQIVVLCFITTFFILVCTSNPIFKDEDSSSQRIVEGKIRLSDNASPESIFVWLESLDISTYTDEEGAFSLQLPPLQSQPGGGLSGEYNIYYYVGNYALASSSLVLQDGSILREAGDVDSEGNIDETVVLRKLLNIKSEINLPNDLIKAIAANANMFDTDYLKIPFRRDLGRLTVIRPTN